MLILKLLVIIGLIRLLSATQKPILCAGIYAGIVLLLNIAFHSSEFFAVVFGTAIAFSLSFIYFFLLCKFENRGLYWIILVCGFLIGVV